MFFGKKFHGYHGKGTSGLDLLVLSIIKNNNAITGYDITRIINKKFKGMWKASAGTIYPLLNRLEEQNLVNVEDIIENNRQKKIYNITEKGMTELKHSLENKLQSSINTVGDYIKTVIKAFPMFSCFPFPDMQEHCMFIPEDVENTKDYNRLKSIVESLTEVKNKLNKKLKEIDKKLSRFNEILEKMKSEAKTIKIEDIEEDF